MKKTIELTPRWLTAAEFSAYGEVVSSANAVRVVSVNDGRAQRFTRLATQQSLAPNLKQELSLYRLNPSSLPLEVSYFERHPLTTQLFYPLCKARYLVLVCPSGADGLPDAARAEAWVVEPGVGINYHAGVWHYPLVALDDGGDFLMLMAEVDVEAEAEAEGVEAGSQNCEIASLQIILRVNPLLQS